MTFTVKVTEITPTVMLVIAGGVLLLVLAGHPDVHPAQACGGAAARPGRDGDGDAEPASRPSDPDGDGHATRKQPSDPAPDTGPESATVRPGEKWTVEPVGPWPDDEVG